MLTPPLDRIPQIPPQLVQLLVEQINKLLDKAFKDLDLLLDKVAVLPENCQCDDPRIKEIEDKLNQVLELINKLKELLPIVDKIVQGVKLLISIAAAIKASIFLTPIVGQAALLSELMIVQNMTIANAIKSVEQLNILPDVLNRGVDSMAKKLATVINSLGSVCSDKEFQVTNEIQDAINTKSYDNIPNLNVGGGGNWILIDGDGRCGSPIGQPPLFKSPYTDNCGSQWVWQGILDPGTGISWGSEQSRRDDETMGTEFYSEINVNAEDLQSRLDVINEIISDQRDLLASLQEAPAQSYEGTGIPNLELGKLGDYYIDKTNKVIYGPKTNTGWPSGVNY
jgi:hypothetical protein